MRQVVAQSIELGSQFEQSSLHGSPLLSVALIHLKGATSMEIRDLFGSNGEDDAPLPQPNADMRRNDDNGEFTEGQIRGIICNPIYAGIGPYPALIDDKMWVNAASRSIEKDGNEQFLVNLLHLLRQSLQDAEIDFG